MKTQTFNALISRMKYITRWGLMNNTRSETLSEHTVDVCFLVHTLASIANNKFGQNVNCEGLVCAALYHDASEIITGDMPTPVKYKDDILKNAYKQTEKNAVQHLCNIIEKDLQKDIAPYLTCETLTSHEKLLLKAADRISAVLKCIDEEKSGNIEFVGAKKTQLQAIKDMQLKEADYFIDNMLSAYRLTLDQLVTAE